MSMGLAQSGVFASSHVSTIFPWSMWSRSPGRGAIPLRGSHSSLLSKTRSSVSFGMRSTRLRRLLSYRSRILASGMSCPPAVTLERTRAIWSSGVARPTYQMRTSIFSKRARGSRLAMCVPPSVVSKAKSDRSEMARSSNRFPWPGGAVCLLLGHTGICSKKPQSCFVRIEISSPTFTEHRAAHAALARAIRPGRS